MSVPTDTTPVLGLQFVDLEPAPVFQQALIGRGTPAAVGVGQPALGDERLRCCSISSRGVPGFRSLPPTPTYCWYFVLHMTSFSSASHSTNVWKCSRWPSQAQVGHLGALCQVVLLGDVDGDAHHGFQRIRIDDLGAGANPDPLAVGMTHAEDAVDAVRLARAIWPARS